MTHEFNLTNKGQNTYSGSMTEPGNGDANPVNPQDQQKEIKPQYSSPAEERAKLEEAAKALKSLPPDVLKKLTKELTVKTEEKLPFAEEQEASETRRELIQARKEEISEEARRLNELDPFRGMVGAATATAFEVNARRLANELTDPVFSSIAAESAESDADFRVLYQQLNESSNSRVNALRDRISDLPDVPANAERRAPLIQALMSFLEEKNRLDEHLKRMERDEPRGLTVEEKREIRDIENMRANTPAEIEARRVRIEGIFNKYAPEDEALDDRILRLIAMDEIVTAQFISRLTISELEGEQWQMKGFYSGINYDKFVRVSGSVQTPKKHQEMLDLVEATTAFHNMNYIITRNFERFGDSAESLKANHFQALMDIKGLDAVVDAYEEAYQMHLAGNTRLTDEDLKYINLEVDEALKKLNDSRQVRGMAGEEMKDWELRRAKILGRSFYRVILRASGLAVLSELSSETMTGSPDPSDPILFASVALRGPTQLLNNLKFTGVRFEPNKELGGPELLKRALIENARVGEGRKNERMQLKTLQGTDVDMRESQNIIGARGVMATWRNAVAVLQQIKFNDVIADENGALRPGETNIVEFFIKNHREAIKGLGDLKPDVRKKGESDEAFRARQAAAKDATRALFKPLIDNTSVALGLMVSPSYLQVPADLKEILWEKAAELNPQMMASLLTRIELNDEAIKAGRSVKSLEQILLETWGDPEQRTALDGGKLNQLKIEIRVKAEDLIKLTNIKVEKRTNQQSAEIDRLRGEIDRDRVAYESTERVLSGLLHNENWTKLLGKLRIANFTRLNNEQARIKEGRLNEAPRDLESYLVDMEKGPLPEEFGKQVLTTDERKVLDAIIANGKLIAPDLARIRQADAWFINDTPHQLTNWNLLGQFYDRAGVSDLGSFQKGTNGALKVTANPFLAEQKEVLAAFREGIEGSGGVIGNVAAQKNQEPLFIAWMDMQQEYPWPRQDIISSFRHATRKPTSRAQEIAGLHAPSLDEDATFDTLELAHAAGVLRTESKNFLTGEEEWNDNLEYMVKKYKVGIMNRMVWSKMRDLGPFFFLSLIINFFKEVASSKR